MTTTESISGALQPFVDRGILAGAVGVVATVDQVFGFETVGFSDLASAKPMQADDLFWIASMTKPMTATALMILVDEGRVDVDAPLTKYLPEFRDLMVIAEKTDDQIVLRKPHRPVLVRDALAHTGGFAFRSPMEGQTLDQCSLHHRVLGYAMTPLVYEPGTQYGYSNIGTNIAGRIIEVVSGKPYEDFMQERLFTPLGMKDTTFFPTEAQLARLVTVYRSNPEKTGLIPTTIDQLTYPLNDASRRAMPAGGLFSTAADVLEFCRMTFNQGEYLGRRYVSAASVQQMTSRQTPSILEQSYGFCWNPTGGIIRHGGAYKTVMTLHPALGFISIILVHQSGDWPGLEENPVLDTFIAAAEKIAFAARG